MARRRNTYSAADYEALELEEANDELVVEDAEVTLEESTFEEQTEVVESEPVEVVESTASGTAIVTLVSGNYLWFDYSGYGYMAEIHAVEPWMVKGAKFKIKHEGEAGTKSFRLVSINSYD